MRKEIYQDSESLKRMLCYSSTPQAIAVTEEMVDYLFQESNDVMLLATTGQSLNEAINDLTIEDSVVNRHHKIIVLVRTSERTPLSVSELSQILSLVGRFPKEADICWGTATAKELNSVTLLIAISSK